LTRLDADAVRSAYRRHAAFYDLAFGAVATAARRRAVSAANALPGNRVLEVGVGTGLALPFYRRTARVTGIDLSSDMLARARTRVAAKGLTHVEALMEQDAEATDFQDDSFDIAVAMFVASVVPHPNLLMAELRRIVKPGGHILFVNHFSASGGPRLAVERAMTPLGRTLGWHPDFPLSALLTPADVARARLEPVPPAGLFTLVHLQNEAPAAARWEHQRQAEMS
jgi:phosphatidylethanolamine/phosphatidyl-N-methylethanolamine N-methyltransferase